MQQVQNVVVYSLGFVNGAVTITGSTNVTASGPLSDAKCFQPSWAKTQDKIAVNARLLSNINVVNIWMIDLLNPASPVNLNVSGIMQSWSPDDSKIAFRANNSQNKLSVFVMNADGTGVTDVGQAQSADQSWPAWRRNP